MKVMSFNVRHSIIEDMFGFWRFRYKKILDFIKKEEPDVLGLQELSRKGRRYLKRHLKDYNVFGDRRHSIILTEEYNSIFIKKKYKVTDCKTYSLSNDINKLGTKSKNDKFPRISVLLHLNLGKYKLMIVNTHIDNSNTDNKKRLLDIYNKIIDDNLKEKEYIILLGDYNMTVRNHNLIEFSKKYIDPFKDYNVGTFPSRPDMMALDHIYLDKRLKYKNDNIYVDSNARGFISDHNPISCEITIPKSKQ